MQYIRNNWFDVTTTLWAVALLVAGTVWFAAPAFAFDEGPDCGTTCMVACDSNGDCDYYIPSSGGCEVYCQDGTWIRCAVA